MRVFRIEQEIDAVWQGDRMIQEYAIELERLWAEYDHFSLSISVFEKLNKIRPPLFSP